VAPHLDLDLYRQPRILLVSTKRRADIEELKSTFNMTEQSTVTDLPTDCYALVPKTSEMPVPKLLEVVVMTDIVTGNPARQENISDSQDSDKVYAFLKLKKIKVLQDDYSYVKNQRLYAAFNLIETKWRILALSDRKLSALIDKTNPEVYRSKALDHKAAQYNLSEFYENFLLAPASDEFIVQEWDKSGKSNDDLIRVRNLRMLDELHFPVTEDELNMLRETRNQCMHFRVTTLEEYCRTVEVVNRYIKVAEMRQLITAVAKVIDPQIQQLSRLLAEQLKPNLSILFGKLNKPWNLT
jgi:hypothetical protein